MKHLQLNIPKSWSDIKVYQYQDMLSNDLNGIGTFEKYIEYLSIITETDSEDWEDMDLDEVLEIIKSIEWLKTSPSTNFKTKIEGLSLIDFNKLELGAYIDIEYFKKDLFKNFHLILAILYRKTKENEWGEIIYEPYDYDINNRSELFLDISINDVYGLINHYHNFYENFINNYSTLFNQDVPEDELDPVDELTEEDKKELKKEQERAKWAWEILIHNLSEKDITKYDEILKLNLIFVFNHLSFKKIFNLD